MDFLSQDYLNGISNASTHPLDPVCYGGSAKVRRLCALRSYCAARILHQAGIPLKMVKDLPSSGASFDRWKTMAPVFQKLLDSGKLNYFAEQLASVTSFPKTDDSKESYIAAGLIRLLSSGNLNTGFVKLLAARKELWDFASLMLAAISRSHTLSEFWVVHLCYFRVIIVDYLTFMSSQQAKVFNQEFFYVYFSSCTTPITHWKSAMCSVGYILGSKYARIPLAKAFLGISKWSEITKSNLKTFANRIINQVNIPQVHDLHPDCIACLTTESSSGGDYKTVGNAILLAIANIIVSNTNVREKDLKIVVHKNEHKTFDKWNELVRKPALAIPVTLRLLPCSNMCGKKERQEREFWQCSCAESRYCSRTCQNSHWKSHKVACKKLLK
eukprot:277669_1